MDAQAIHLKAEGKVHHLQITIPNEQKITI